MLPLFFPPSRFILLDENDDSVGKEDDNDDIDRREDKFVQEIDGPKAKWKIKGSG